MDGVKVTTTNSNHGIPGWIVLEVRGEVRNEGDIGASDILVSLFENGQRRYETTIEKVSVGEQVPFTLYWSPLLLVPRTSK